MYLAVDTETGTRYATKVVDKSRGKSVVDTVLLEIKLLSKLKHPSIVSCLGSFETEKLVGIHFVTVVGRISFDPILKIKNVFFHKDVWFRF